MASSRCYLTALPLNLIMHIAKFVIAEDDDARTSLVPLLLTTRLLHALLEGFRYARVDIKSPIVSHRVLQAFQARQNTANIMRTVKLSNHHTSNSLRDFSAILMLAKDLEVINIASKSDPHWPDNAATRAAWSRVWSIFTMASNRHLSTLPGGRSLQNLLKSKWRHAMLESIANITDTDL